MKRDQRLVVVCLIATIAVSLLAAGKGKGELGPKGLRIAIGAAFAFFIIGAIAEFNSKLGRSLAILVTIGAIMVNGEAAIETLPFADRRKGPKPDPSNTSQRSRWIHGTGR